MELEKQKLPVHNKIKLGIIGNVDSGKSTLVGVLSKGINDDGNGSARSRVANYKHEMETGRTSSIGQEIMGFNNQGKQVVLERFNQNKNKYWREVAEHSSKIVSLVDLCGHEKYLKTTINGLTGMSPDFGCVVVGANMGVQKMTKQHIGLCLFLKIPFFVVLTKIDIAPENKYEETLSEIKKITRSKILNKLPIVINENTSKNEISKTAELVSSGNICPIFSISSVTGIGMEKLVDFISQLEIPKLDRQKLIKEPFEVQIHETFIVEGVGLILSGIIRSGIATLNKQCLLGPDKLKNFKQVSIKSIHLARVAHEQAFPGDLVCMAIKSIKANQKLVRKDIRKGMVLLDINNKPEPVTEFQAELQVLHHSTTIGLGYEGVLHCGTIQQTVTLKEIFEAQVLRNEDKGLCRFRFKYRPEFIKAGEIVLLREGKTKIIGTITRVFEN